HELDLHVAREVHLCVGRSDGARLADAERLADLAIHRHHGEPEAEHDHDDDEELPHQHEVVVGDPGVHRVYTLSIITRYTPSAIAARTMPVTSAFFRWLDVGLCCSI